MLDYAEEVEQFMRDGEQYMMEVERVVKVNTIVEAIVAAVSCLCCFLKILAALFLNYYIYFLCVLSIVSNR